MMRRLALSALLLAACSGPPSASTPVSPSAAVSAAASAAPARPAVTPSPGPSATVRVGDSPRSFARFGFETGSHEGTVNTDERLQIGAAPAKGTYSDPYGRAISDERGTWTSSAVRAPFEFDQLVASWNATTPSGTWIEGQMRASGASRTTKWYTLAIWASGDDTIHRATLKRQDDADGRVNVDTFEKAVRAAELTSYELRVALHRAAGVNGTPTLALLTAVTSRAGDHPFLPGPSGVARDLDVPMLSQETHAGHYPEYDGGGEAWCSPTSTAMVLGFWKTGPSANDLAAFPGAAHADGRVDHAARYTYDWSYEGAGNWPFNAAYAASYGLESFITRLRSL